MFCSLAPQLFIMNFFNRILSQLIIGMTSKANKDNRQDRTETFHGKWALWGYNVMHMILGMARYVCTLLVIQY